MTATLHPPIGERTRSARVQTFSPLWLSTVELAYAKKGLRDVCEIRATAEKQLGTQTAAGLRRRLADLDAASTIDELIAEPTIETAVDGERAVRIGDGKRLVFRSNHNKAPVTGAGKIDWTQVTRIQFLRIESDQ